eukprot:m.112711 g.112711  ORF g.112711 m.112711 type:complete len:198 (-) comp13484_c0_seq8:311-904(-)
MLHVKCFIVLFFVLIFILFFFPCCFVSLVTPQTQVDAATKAQRKEEQQAQQRKREAAQQVQSQNAKAKAQEKPFQHLATWLEIQLKPAKEDGECVFEFTLPPWLSTDDDFLDAYDLDEGMLVLTPDEVHDSLIGGVKWLYAKYCGQEASAITFELGSLDERASAKRVLAIRDGLPPWYQHPHEPMTAEEVDAGTVSE